MKYPNAPADCREILFKTYAELMNKKITKTDWGLFSGRFNRHVHFKIKQCGKKKQKAFRYLFLVWQQLNQLTMLHGKLLMIPKAHRVRVQLTVLKGLLQEALDEC